MDSSVTETTVLKLLLQDLRTPKKKPGFLANLRAATKYFVKKPGFWAPMRRLRCKSMKVKTTSIIKLQT
ncbi:MAG: hypothetical protein EAZ78_15200 [Oscillatoriales cyanobacterium]|nr:MAG: hypothetical protein EAZ78_15200 [Oscillatoriales cyanobacterium]TAF41644.1 MAG: hypothetical protein EAZ68_10330 [Oscillatoriales cyanobacterium]